MRVGIAPESVPMAMVTPASRRRFDVLHGHGESGSRFLGVVRLILMRAAYSGACQEASSAGSTAAVKKRSFIQAGCSA